jgi:phosphinothricin acetyltransferase
MITIATMTPDHWPQVREIYAAGIATGNATFETDPPDWAAWDEAHLSAHRLVALDDDRVVGWAAVVPVSSRCVYTGVVEHSVYVHPDAQGQGVGGRLLDALIGSTEAAGIWTIQTGIFPDNESSLVLHERHGFRRIGVRERVGQHHGRWRDVVLLERRSRTVGR